MDDPETRSVRLMKVECLKIMHSLPPIATLTYYRGDSPEDYLRQRVREILQANPWLSGTLCTDNEGTRLNYSIHPSKECFFVERNYSSLPFPENDDAAYNIMDDRLLGLLPKRSADILNNHAELLFKVVLLCISDDKFALLCAMNHTIGDGHTFYAIHRMLSEDSEITSMIVDRNEEALSLAEQYPFVTGSYCRSWMFLINATVSALKNVIFRLLTSAVSLISPIPILKIKQRWVYAILPISTNDIITSAFFRATRCDIGLMAINIRPRVPELTDSHAGNYESVLGMRLKDYESPVSVRNAVHAVNKRTKNPTIFPGFWKTLFLKFTLITNWATFYHDLKLRNCILVRHHPVFDLTKAPFEFCCIFRPRMDRLAIVTTTIRHSSAREELLSHLDG